VTGTYIEAKSFIGNTYKKVGAPNSLNRSAIQPAAIVGARFIVPFFLPRWSQQSTHPTAHLSPLSATLTKNRGGVEDTNPRFQFPAFALSADDCDVYDVH
jgi:hypothetical protein